MNSSSATAPRRRAWELKSTGSGEWGIGSGEHSSLPLPTPDSPFPTHYAKLTRPQTAGARRQEHAADHEGDENGRRGQASPRAGARSRRAPLHAEDDADSGRRGPTGA